MKLIDRIMRDICDVMEWLPMDNFPPGTWSHDIQARLTPRCDAVDAVVQAARGCKDYPGGSNVDDLCDCATFYPDDCVHPHCVLRKLYDALAALDEVRDVD